MYTITELINSAELEEEGLTMRHCVASYRPLCESGEESIWSLTVEDASGQADRLLTLEVRNRNREIVQARGRCNRLAEIDELHILSQWMRAGGPTLSPAMFSGVHFMD